MGLKDRPGTLTRLRRASLVNPDSANALACAALTVVGGTHIASFPRSPHERRREVAGQLMRLASRVFSVRKSTHVAFFFVPIQ